MPGYVDPIISHIETIERMTDLWPLAPETLKLLDLAKEAQRTGKMPDLSGLNDKLSHEEGEIKP